MLYFWLMLTWLLPVAGCLFAVSLAGDPNLLTAAAGAFVGAGAALLTMLMVF